MDSWRFTYKCHGERTMKRKCAQCQLEYEEEELYQIAETEEQCGKNWIEKIWVKLGYQGEFICHECYFQ